VDTKLTESRRLLDVIAEPTGVEPEAGSEPTAADHDMADAKSRRCPHCGAPLRRCELPPLNLNQAPTRMPMLLVAALDSS